MVPHWLIPQLSMPSVWNSTQWKQKVAKRDIRFLYFKLFVILLAKRSINGIPRGPEPKMTMLGKQHDGDCRKFRGLWVYSFGPVVWAKRAKRKFGGLWVYRCGLLKYINHLDSLFTKGRCLHSFDFQKDMFLESILRYLYNKHYIQELIHTLHRRRIWHFWASPSYTVAFALNMKRAGEGWVWDTVLRPYPRPYFQAARPSQPWLGPHSLLGSAPRKSQAQVPGAQQRGSSLPARCTEYSTTPLTCQLQHSIDFFLCVV